jgi:hypothetical protein
MCTELKSPLSGTRVCGERSGVPFRRDRPRRAHLAHILELLGEDSRLNVHAGELDVRPPAAPTTRGGTATGDATEGRASIWSS